jgi:excisionase family DNA binding protein
MNSKLLTLEQVAEYLGVHRDTVYGLVRSGRLAALQLGGRKTGWRVTEEDLRAFVETSKGGLNDQQSDRRVLEDFDRTQADELEAFRDAQRRQRREFVSGQDHA